MCHNYTYELSVKLHADIFNYSREIIFSNKYESRNRAAIFRPRAVCMQPLFKKTRPDTRPIPVADGWAGAEMRVFPLFDSITTDQPPDQPTNGRTDKASYRVASPRLKKPRMDQWTDKVFHRDARTHL